LVPERLSFSLIGRIQALRIYWLLEQSTFASLKSRCHEGHGIKIMKITDVLSRMSSIPSRIHGAVVKNIKLNLGGNQYPATLPVYLGGGGPGGYVSSHYAESRQVTSWSFIAIHAIACAAAKSKPQVHFVGRAARRRVDGIIRKGAKGMVPSEVVEAVKASVNASKSGDDSVPVPSNHPLMERLRRPNPYMTRAQFLFQHAQQCCATGTTLLWTRRNNYREFDPRGVPVESYIIPTGITLPLPPDGNIYPEGAYRVMPVGSFGGRPDDNFGEYSWSNLMMQGGIIDGREIRPIRWPHPIFLSDGLSPMEAGNLWIDIGNQLDRATWHAMKNTLRPGYIFAMDATFEEPAKEESDRFDAWIASRSSGIDNVGKHFRLPKGINIADADRTARDLDYVQGRDQIGQNILSLWKVPPIAAGIQQAGAYAAYIASLYQFTEQAVEPVLQLLSDDLEREWAPAYGEDGELELKIPPPPVNDHEQMEAALNARAQLGAITFDEYRKSINLPPLPNKIGQLLVTTHIGPLIADELGIELPSDPDTNNPALQGAPPVPKVGNQPRPPKSVQVPERDRKPNPAAQDRPSRIGGASDQGGATRARKPSRTKSLREEMRTLMNGHYPALMLPTGAKLNGYR